MENLRTRTILGELERATSDYRAVKERYVTAMAEFEAARERFISIRRLASEALAGNEWFEWERAHSDVKFVGMEIGNAIESVLDNHAYKAAFKHVKEPEQTTYSPAMHVQSLIASLESGGFEFKSSTPLREINAAVINKQKKVARLHPGIYQIANAPAILDEVRAFSDDMKQRESPVEQTVLANKENDDDVPF